MPIRVHVIKLLVYTVYAQCIICFRLYGVSCSYRALISTAIERVSELPFLDLGDETRVSGEGKVFGVLDFALMLNDTELPVSFPFGNGTETEIYVSYKLFYAESQISRVLTTN